MDVAAAAVAEVASVIAATAVEGRGVVVVVALAKTRVEVVRNAPLTPTPLLLVEAYLQPPLSKPRGSLRLHVDDLPSIMNDVLLLANSSDGRNRTCWYTPTPTVIM